MISRQKIRKMPFQYYQKRHYIGKKKFFSTKKRELLKNNVFLFIDSCIEMKKWLFIPVFIWLTLPVKSQIAFGARAGIAYTSLTQIIDEEVTYGGRVGFNIAGMLDVPISRKFSLRPELSFLSQGGAYSLEFREKETIWERYKRNYYAIQIPVNFAYKIFVNEWQFGAYGGPTVSLSTKVKEREGLEERRFRTFDIGAGAGFYVERRNLFFTIYSHTGLVDRLAEKRPNESNLYQNNVIFSFGYWFRK